MTRGRFNRPDITYRLGPHRLRAPCVVCGAFTREGVAIDFPTRARGAAALSRAYGNEPDPDDAKRLKAIPMTVEFCCHAQCSDQFWGVIGERRPVN